MSPCKSFLPPSCRHLLDTPELRDSASIFDMLRRCIFVAGLAASAEAFQPVGAARVRGASFAPTPTWRRASPAVALELRGVHAKSAWRLASENPRPVLPRPCVRPLCRLLSSASHARPCLRFDAGQSCQS